MAGRERGLYEVLVTEALDAELHDLGDRLEPKRGKLRAAEAADRVALHLARVIQRAVAAVGDHERVAAGVALARKLIDVIDQTIEVSRVTPDRPLEPGQVLRAIRGRLPDGQPETIRQPLTEQLLFGKLQNGGKAVAGVVDGGIVVEVPE